MATPKKPRTVHPKVDKTVAQFGTRAPVVVKRREGRPTAYRKEYCAMLVEHMGKGRSFETFGIEVGVHPDTVDVWASLEVVEVNGTKVERPKHPEFRSAKKEGVKAALKYWEQLGVDLITGKIKGKAAVWIFSMKNRFKWTDRMENIVEDLRQPLPGASDAEKSERLRVLMQNPEARKLIEQLQKLEEKMLPKPTKEEKE